MARGRALGTDGRALRGPRAHAIFGNRQLSYLIPDISLQRALEQTSMNA